jgi:two-component system NtrC family sensor kinase
MKNLDTAPEQNAKITVPHGLRQSNEYIVQLQESELNLRALIENSVGPIWSMDRMLRLIVGNARFHDLVLSSTGQRIASGDRLPDSFHADWTDSYQRVLSGESLTIEVPTDSDVTLWSECRLAPLYSPQGDIYGMTVFVRDISKRKKAKAELKRTKEFLHQLLWSANAPIIVWDSELLITLFNRAAEQFSGFESEEMIGRHIDLLFSEGYRRQLSLVHCRTRSDIGDDSVEIPIQRPDGEIRIALWTSLDVSGDDPMTSVATIALGHDITQRLKIEQHLRESEASFRMLVDNAPDAILVQTDGKFVYVNQAALVLFAAGAPEQLLGTAVIDRFPFEKQHLIRERIMRLNLERQSVPTIEEQFFRIDGTLVDVEVSAVPFNYQGRHGALIFARDITARKKAETTLREVESRLIQQDKMASIGQLAAGIAHEINNPMGFIASNLVSLRKYLARINNYIEIMEHETGVSCSREGLERIDSGKSRLKIDRIQKDLDNLISESLDGTDRVKKIISDLKSFARSDGTGRLELADLNQCIKNTINIVRNEIKYVATLQLDLGEIPLVLCNQQQISQVVMNLLVNAAQAISSQGEIMVRTCHDTEVVSISVRDTGCGIAEENMTRIFDPFYTTKEIGKGTGLGLSISHDIITKHGGEIRVESVIGAGTLFTVRLPVNGPSSGMVEFGNERRVASTHEEAV